MFDIIKPNRFSESNIEHGEMSLIGCNVRCSLRIGGIEPERCAHNIIALVYENGFNQVGIINGSSGIHFLSTGRDRVNKIINEVPFT